MGMMLISGRIGRALRRLSSVSINAADVRILKRVNNGVAAGPVRWLQRGGIAHFCFVYSTPVTGAYHVAYHASTLYQAVVSLPIKVLLHLMLDRGPSTVAAEITDCCHLPILRYTL